MSPYSTTEFPFTIPVIKNKSEEATNHDSKVKGSGSHGDSLGDTSLHQQLNILEIAVILIIGATTAIGKRCILLCLEFLVKLIMQLQASDISNFKLK